MYCNKCQCEFPDWVHKCPSCKAFLAKEMSPQFKKLLERFETAKEKISYEELVRLVKENGGQLKIDLVTTDVGMEKEYGFPFQGYGFAWAENMMGLFNNILADLRTTEFGKYKKFMFPYMGFGFAWSKRIEGNIGGNGIILKAKKVDMEKKYGFPYKGYGFAWTQEMSGECGRELRADLVFRDVKRNKRLTFPFFGFGFAWVDKAVLTLSLK